MIRNFLQVCFSVLLLVFILISIQTRASAKERVGQSYIDVPGPLKGGTVASLKSYVSSLMKKKYVSADKLYDAPPEGLEEKIYISVKREKAVPIIASGLSDFSGNEEGIAAALNDGTIRVWSNFSCKKVRLPEGKGAEKVAYAPGSPFLAATDSKGESLYIYDLEKCSKVAGQISVMHAPVERMALSSTGDWLGLIDDFNVLRCGPSLGPLQELSVLEGTPVYLGYTPGQGILVTVEASGQVVMWGMKNQSRISSDDVPGGPFVSARMSGYVLSLQRDDGKEIYWSLRKRETVEKSEALKESPLWVYEQDGSLVYSAGVDRWKVSEHLGMPMFIVSYSVSEKMIRVRDVDTETRYYSTLNGKEFSAVAASDWKLLSPEKGVYSVGGKDFRLYDFVCQKGNLILYSRYLKGKGFYLWWQQTPHPAYTNPYPMSLPMRENVLAEKSASWTPLLQGEIR